MKRILLIIWAVTLTAAASMAFGQGAGMKHPSKGCPGMGCPGMAGLSEDQQKKVEALNLEVEKALLPLKAQMDVKTAELKVLAVAENPDKAAIDKKIEEIGALRTQMMKKKVLNGLAVRALLTPDQRVGFDQKALRECCGPMDCREQGAGPEMRHERMSGRMRHGGGGMMRHDGGEMMRHQGPEKVEEKVIEKEVTK
jgi:Spy/CpxP family protein refolding chaperone